MSVEIQVMKVGKGDCIWLRYGEESKTNIIIDSGTAVKAGEFKRIVKSIEDANEVIELLVLTHIDNDHINGFNKYISEYDGKIIKEVWFHGSGADAYMETSLHSPKNAPQLVDILKEKNININTNVYKKYKKNINEAELYVLTPTFDAVSKVAAIIDDYAEAHEGKIGNQDLDWLYEHDEYKRDTSDTNAASISFVFSYEGKNIAFLGDAHAEDIIESKNELLKDIQMDLVKLPHHGSSHNITEELIQCLGSKKFIISTDQSIDKKSLARIVHAVDNCTIYCNYEWWASNNYFTEKDREDYLDKDKLVMKELKKGEFIEVNKENH